MQHSDAEIQVISIMPNAGPEFWLLTENGVLFISATLERRASEIYPDAVKIDVSAALRWIDRNA